MNNFAMNIPVFVLILRTLLFVIQFPQIILVPKQTGNVSASPGVFGFAFMLWYFLEYLDFCNWQGTSEDVRNLFWSSLGRAITLQDAY